MSFKIVFEIPFCSVDCDVGPWGEWTSCYLPPDMCGVGSKDRSRYTFVFIKVYIVVKYEGEIAQALKVKVLILLLLFNREQIAEAQHHGEKCAKPRIIELMESQACNVECKSPGKEFSFSPADITRFVNGTGKLYPCFQLTAKLDLGKNGLLALLRAERALEIEQGQMSPIIITKQEFPVSNNRIDAKSCLY